MEEAISIFLSYPEVLHAEPNYIRRALVVPPDDPDFLLQWNLDTIDIQQAWDRADPRTDLVIAMIDSGLDLSHPDLINNLWQNPGDLSADGIDDDQNGYIDDLRGWDFIGGQFCILTSDDECLCQQDQPGGSDNPGDNEPQDDFGHGSHVSGIVAAEGNNGIGISGILWKARLMPLKIIDRNGCGSAADEIQAIHYAIKNGAKIINASFGAPGPSQFEHDAIAAANAAGILFVAAAGNDGESNDVMPIFPASYDLPNVISVGASDQDDRLSKFSNFSRSRVDLTAPGEGIRSTVPFSGCPAALNLCSTSGYEVLSGTSMSAPHVTGSAGLLLVEDPTLLPSELKAILSLTVDPQESLKGRIASAGRLNANSALIRDPSSGLTGGGGGCGAFALTGGGPLPPTAGLGSLLPFLFPLFFILLRKWYKHSFWKRIPLGIRDGRTFLWWFLLVSFSFYSSNGYAAELNKESASLSPHSLGMKFGYHTYPNSEYFDTNGGYFEATDFSSVAGELEYEYQYKKSRSIAIALGYYDGSSSSGEICCTRLKFQTTYLILSPKYDFSLKYLSNAYVGGGLGAYFLKRKQSGIVKDSFSGSTFGIHGLLGMKKGLLSSVTSFLELRYSVAVIKSANDFDDRLDIGGLTLFLGASYHFTQRP